MLHISLFTLHIFFCLIRQLIEGCLKLHPKRFKHASISLARDPERSSIEEEASGEWVRDHEAVPARKEFFFEHAKIIGTMGSPLALANWITPSLATCRGPFGPSGVTAIS